MLIKFIYGFYIFAENSYIDKIIGKFIFFLNLDELCLLQLFDVLRDRRLRIIEFGDDILIADQLARRVASHDETKNFNTDGMSQCVRNVCNE